MFSSYEKREYRFPWFTSPGQGRKGFLPPHYSEQAFRAALDSLREALPGMEDWQAILRLQEIICHTGVFRDDVNEGPAFPIGLCWFEKGDI